jgi:hypothetical protein
MYAGWRGRKREREREERGETTNVYYLNIYGF